MDVTHNKRGSADRQISGALRSQLIPRRRSQLTLSKTSYIYRGPRAESLSCICTAQHLAEAPAPPRHDIIDAEENPFGLEDLIPSFISCCRSPFLSFDIAPPAWLGTYLGYPRSGLFRTDSVSRFAFLIFIFIFYFVSSPDSKSCGVHLVAGVLLLHTNDLLELPSYLPR